MTHVFFVSVLCIAALAGNGLQAFAADEAVKGLPESDGGDRRFAWVRIGDAKRALVVNGNTVLFDRNGDGDVSAANEAATAVVEKREAPLFRNRPTALATIGALDGSIKELNVQWDPTTEIPGVFVFTGNGEQQLELAFCPFAPKPDSAPLLWFGSNERVFAVFGEPFTAHRALGHDQPTLVVRIGRFGSEGVFVSQWHTQLATDKNPKATITYNPGTPEEQKVDVVLLHRC